jgi:hypothetical protein
MELPNPMLLSRERFHFCEDLCVSAVCRLCEDESGSGNPLSAAPLSGPSVCTGRCVDECAT